MASSAAKLSLEEIRSDLIRQEETIIFALIERAQFKRNIAIYQPGFYEHISCSFLEYFFGEVERVHSASRRYTAPDEHPFFPSKLVDPMLPLLNFTRRIQPNKINLNDKIRTLYCERIVPILCEPGDDQQHGSSANADVAALQAISKRVHYGKFVAEAKFQQNPSQYSERIQARDAAGLAQLLTNEEIEQKLLRRVWLKAQTYGRDVDDNTAPDKFKVSPDVVVALYRDYLIPLNKEVQVQYLLQRLGPPSVAFLGPEGSFSQLAAQQHFGAEPQTEFMPCSSISEVFAAVLSNRTLCGVVPLENNTAGKVHATLEQIVYSDAQLVAELYVPVQHQLLSHVSSKSAVRRVLSHPQALEQCREYCRSQLPNAQLVSCASTAAAAQLAAKALPADGVAALASRVAAQLHAVPVLDGNVQDNKRNVTRFVVITKHACNAPSGRDAVLLVVSVNDRPGALARVVAAFAAHNLNLSTIESFLDSHQQQQQQQQQSFEWSYRFLIQVEAHHNDTAFQEALRDLQPYVSTVRIVGSFQDRSVKRDSPVAN